MLKIISREEDGIGILQLRGKLIGPPETDDLHTLVRGMLDRNMKKFVIDLTYVSWMGSLGIGALIRCLLTVRSVQGEIHFAALRRDGGPPADGGARQWRHLMVMLNEICRIRGIGRPG